MKIETGQHRQQVITDVSVRISVGQIGTIEYQKRRQRCSAGQSDA